MVARPDVRFEAVETALVEMEQARVAYNTARDKFAEELLRSSGDAQKTPLLSRSGADGAPKVKELAQLIWELTGRLPDTADDDWRRAEEILRRSVAA